MSKGLSGRKELLSGSRELDCLKMRLRGMAIANVMVLQRKWLEGDGCWLGMLKIDWFWWLKSWRVKR